VAHGGVYTFGLPLVLSNISMAEIDRRGIHHTNILTAELREGRLACTAWEENFKTRVSGDYPQVNS
jgi:hypothetical protein